MMTWLRRLFLLPALALLILVLSYFGGYEVMPADSYQNALVLAVAGGAAVFVALRLFAAVALGFSLLLSLFLILAVVILSQYFFLEYERDRSFNNQLERQQTVAPKLPAPEQTKTYLRMLDIEPSVLAPENWLAHSRHQANTGLAAEQLRPDEIGEPRQKQTPDDVWLNWLVQLVLLTAGIMAGGWMGRRK